MARQPKETLGVPPGFQLYSCFPFAGLNLTSARTALRDQEFYDIENFVRVGDGNLRTLWDVGTSIYNAPSERTIINAFFYNIATTQYAAVFLDDGTGVQVDVATGTTVPISSVGGSFYASGNLPGCCQWGSQYLLIGNNIRQDNYYVWDGSLLYSAGSIAPDVTVTSGGSGYTSPPAISVYGGSGSGATFQALVQDGFVTTVYVTNPGSGYQIGDEVHLAFSGGGSDSSAILQATIGNGGVQSVTVTNGGSGYTQAPTVVFGGGTSGSGATGTAVLTGTEVSSITVTDGGSGYNSPPLVTIGTPPSGGQQATAVATLDPFGEVNGFTITNPGSGYLTAPSVTVGTQPSSPAGGIANVVAGVVISVTVTTQGTNYSEVPSITFSGGGGSGAQAVAYLAQKAVSSIEVIKGGSGYNGTPTLTIEGDGSGATATAIVSSGAISAVTVNNGGSGYDYLPAVEVEAGVNNAASATLTLMPYGVSGTCIETYASRVWIGDLFTPTNNPQALNNGNKFNVSAPESLSDFATSDGGLVYTSQDRFLRQTYTALRQTNGYLYPVGDSSVAIVSGVNTTGNPPTTTFNYQNTDPQIGTPWRDSCQDFGRVVLFANPFGVYGVYGGAVNKVSPTLDSLFANTYPNSKPITYAIVPSSACANIYGKKYYILLMTVVDPITLTSGTKMILWDENSWFLATQSINLTFICTQEVDSNLTAWGSDGKGLYPLFQTPSATLTKKIQTKLWGGNNPFMLKTIFGVLMQGQNKTTPGGAVTLSISIDTDAGTYPMAETSFSLSSGYPTGYPLVNDGKPDVSGLFLGATISTTDADMTLSYFGIGYVNENYETSSIGAAVTQTGEPSDEA